MFEEVQEVLISEEEISNMVKELATRISRDYEGKELVLVGVLKGGFMFLADLARYITIPLDIEFISVSSYGSSTKSSGIVKLVKDVDIDISDKHVLLVEDIVDTGLTLKHLKELFKTKGSASVKVCSAFDKPSRRKVEIDIDYKGISIPDKFIVGYGLDYAGKYRNLPNVCILESLV